MKLLVLANKLPAFRKTRVKHYTEDSTAVFPKLKPISVTGMRICAAMGDQRKSRASKALQRTKRSLSGKDKWSGKLGRSAVSFSAN